MRYIYYIIAVMIAALVLVVYQLMPTRQSSNQQPAIVINERVITMDEFAKNRPPHDEYRQELVNSIITRELLIQEAQKAGIDKEESFRKSVQNFYEQSLVKVLMDRKFAQLKVEVTDEEVDRYRMLLGSKVVLTVFTAANDADFRASKFSEAARTEIFKDLSRNMKRVVSALKTGEKGAPIKTGEQYVVIRLDDVKPGGSRTDMGREEIKKMMLEEKREAMISDWMDDMKGKAKIQVYVNGKVGG